MNIPYTERQKHLLQALAFALLVQQSPFDPERLEAMCVTEEEKDWLSLELYALIEAGVACGVQRCDPTAE